MERKGGRRPLVPDDRTVNVSVRLPSKQYSRTEEEAKRAALPLSEWLRRVIDRSLSTKGKL